MDSSILDLSHKCDFSLMQAAGSCKLHSVIVENLALIVYINNFLSNHYSQFVASIQLCWSHNFACEDG